MVTEYLEFKEDKEYKGKTRLFEVYSKKFDVYLGRIKWNPGWRQYVFYPDFDTLYSNGCMLQVITFIDKLMEERKNGKTKN